jgi:hypothetical protein
MVPNGGLAIRPWVASLKESGRPGSAMTAILPPSHLEIYCQKQEIEAVPPIALARPVSGGSGIGGGRRRDMGTEQTREKGWNPTRHQQEQESRRRRSGS